MSAEALAPSERHTFTHNGRVIYEWDQTLTEVNIYIPIPAGVKAKDLAIDIQSSHLKVGIKGNPPYLDVSFITSLPTPLSLIAGARSRQSTINTHIHASTR